MRTTHLHIRGDDRNPDKNRAIEPAIPAFLSLGDFRVEPITLPAESYEPGLRPFVVESHLKAAEARIATARSALANAKTARDHAGQVAKGVEHGLAVIVAEKALAAAESQLASIKASRGRGCGEAPGLSRLARISPS